MGEPTNQDTTKPSEPTVLIADNDAGVTMVLTHVLQRAGVQRVESVVDGSEAVDRIREGGIDLLICDLDMPTMSGEELLAELGTWDAPPPVLVVSAFLDPGVVADLAKSKAYRGSMAKPFDLHEFSAEVRAILEPEPDEESRPADTPEVEAQGGAS